MEKEKVKKLYPLKFQATVEEMPWGTQTWALADLGFINSEISNGWLEGNSMEDLMETYIDRAVGEACYQYYGRQFPVAVRYMDIKGETPLQVHPDDEEAMQRYDALGKAELIYVVEAEADARLYLGFNRQMSAQELYTRCMDGTIGETLHEITPTAGEYYMVKPGLVNAFKGRLKLIVIQESSDVNLVLHSKDHTAEDEEMQMMHLSEAIDMIDYEPYQLNGTEAQANEAAADANADASQANGTDAKANEAQANEAAPQANAANAEAADGSQAGTATQANGAVANEAGAEKKPTDKNTELLVARPEFTISRITLSDPLQMSLEHLGCFLIYTCVHGAASIQIPSVNEKNEKCMENYEFKEGDVVLVPAEIPGFFLVPRDRDTILLETMVESHEEIDSYIDPNTEPFLEGEDYEGLEDGDEEEEDDCSCGHDDGECHCHDHGDGECHCHDDEDDDHECHCHHHDKPLS